MHRAAKTAAIALSASCAACSSLVELNAGPTIATPTGDVTPSSYGVAGAGSLGIGGSAPEGGEVDGIDLVLRAKVTRSSQQLAPGLGIYLERLSGRQRVILHAGGAFFFERHDETFYGGLGPYASLALGIPLSDRLEHVNEFFVHTRRTTMMLTLGPAIDVDFRFTTNASGTLFSTFNVGLAWSEIVIN